MKKILSLAVAAALVAPVAAMADSTVYGKIRVATNYSTTDMGGVETDLWGLYDESSRLGIKGSEDLGGGLKAVYKMEFGVAVGSGFGGMTGRNAYVGLAGGFGTFLTGRHDTPLKMSTGKLDFFADTQADYDTGGAGGPQGHSGLFQDRRVNGVLAYVSPSMGGFTGAIAFVQTGTNDDFSNAYSLAGMYGNGPFYVSGAYEQLDASLLGATEDHKQYRLGFGVLDIAGFSGSLIYEDVSNNGGTKDSDLQSIQGQVAYKFGDNTFKGMYGQQDQEMAGGADDTLDVWGLGYQYNLSKRTDVQVILTGREQDKADMTYDGFSLQMNHNF